VAGQASAISSALHPDQFVLAQSGRALVSRTHRQSDPTRGVFTSVSDLCGAIIEFLDATNDNPKPFVWTASAESIIAKVTKCRAISRALH
jgi:hypothetical protein